MSKQPPDVRVMYAALVYWILLGIVFTFVLATRPEIALCDTDTSCMELFGGDGGPELRGDL